MTELFQATIRNANMKAGCALGLRDPANDRGCDDRRNRGGDRTGFSPDRRRSHPAHSGSGMLTIRPMPGRTWLRRCWVPPLTIPVSGDLVPARGQSVMLVELDGPRDRNACTYPDVILTDV